MISCRSNSVMAASVDQPHAGGGVVSTGPVRECARSRAQSIGGCCWPGGWWIGPSGPAGIRQGSGVGFRIGFGPEHAKMEMAIWGPLQTVIPTGAHNPTERRREGGMRDMPHGRRKPTEGRAPSCEPNSTQTPITH